MHRTVRKAVTSFLAITGLFAITVLTDYGMIARDEQSLAMIGLVVVAVAVRGLMYLDSVRHGREPEVQTRDTVTGNLIVVLSAVAYGWLLMGILVGTGVVSSAYESALKEFYGWLSLGLFVVAIVVYTIDTFKLRKGRGNEAKADPAPAPTETAQPRELIHQGRA